MYSRLRPRKRLTAKNIQTMDEEYRDKTVIDNVKKKAKERAEALRTEIGKSRLRKTL